MAAPPARRCFSSPAQLIGGLHVCAPAVDAADPAHCAQHRDHRAAGSAQFLLMKGCLQFVGGVGQGRKGKGRVVHHHAQRCRAPAPQVVLPEGEAQSVHMAAVLLGNEVGGGMGRFGVQAEPGALSAVGIGFA